MLEGYTAFWCMIVVQALVYVLFCVWFRVPVRRALNVVLWSLILALPLGLFHDLFYFRVLGNGGYLLGFGSIFMILNSVFSFGLFLAAFAVLPVRLVVSPVSRPYVWILLFSITSLAVLATTVPSSQFIVQICGGLVFLLIGEVCLVLAGYGHMSTRFFALLHFWPHVVFLGVIYEIANVVSPVWYWNQYEQPWYIASTLLVVFGYGAFAYADFGFYHLAKKHIRMLL